MTDRLKEATAPAHQALEGVLVPVIRQISTVNAYAQLLRLFYGYFSPLEDAIGLYLNKTYLPDYAERRKTDLLLHDLRLSGYTGDLPETAGELPEINNVPEAFGALYVMEGSTLGGKVIASMIRKNLQLTSDDALSFFSGYKASTGGMWKVFTTALNQYAAVNGYPENMIQAANETFILFKRWVESKIKYDFTEKKL